MKIRSFVKKIVKKLGFGIPRSNRIWVIGGNKGLRFADNSMYFYIYCLKNLDKKVIWLTRSQDIVNEVASKGGQAYLTDSLLGLYYGFRAKWHVFDISIGDTNVLTSVGANWLNLWHGYPLKDIRGMFKVQRAAANDRGFKSIFFKLFPRRNSEKDRYYLLWPNEKYKQHALDSFDVKSDNLIIANMPRNMVFQSGFVSSLYFSEKLMKIRKDFEKIKSEDSRLIGYFPTWRGDGEDLFLGIDDINEMRKFNEFLREKNLIIVTKWHTCSYREYQHSGESVKAAGLTKSLREMSNVYLLEFETDLNAILPDCDALVTDYSSVLYDYLLSDLPMIFYPYDMAEYAKQWGFFVDYEKSVPGHLVFDLQSFRECVASYARDSESFSLEYKEKRQFTRDAIFLSDEGCGRILKRVQEIA